MYESFYNLKAEPFRLTPDHKFCYSHSSYRKAKAYMQYAFERAEGFVMITGKAGTGKTTLVNDLIDSLPKSKVKVATLVSTQLEADDLLRMSAFAFGLDSNVAHKATLLQDLAKLLISNHKKGQRALLIVDEAQDLSVSSLEELRLLTNFQINNHQLVQIFLLGQEKLGELIRRPDMEQVHQRLIAAHHLNALSEEDTKAYIKHRLTKAGWRGDPAISNAVYSIVFQSSGGIPRRINSICSRLLLHGSVEQLHQLGVLDGRIVLEELEQEGLAGAIRSTDIDFNAEDEYDLDDLLVEGNDNEQEKKTFSLEPYHDKHNDGTEPEANDTNDNIEKLNPGHVKDTWISKTPEPGQQESSLNDSLEDVSNDSVNVNVDSDINDPPNPAIKDDSPTNLNNPNESESHSANLNNGQDTKRSVHRRFFIYTGLGIIFLIAGLSLLSILFWPLNSNTLSSFFAPTKAIEIVPKTSFYQKSNDKVDAIDMPPQLSGSSERNSERKIAPPPATKQEINIGQTEEATSKPILIARIEETTSPEITIEKDNLDTSNTYENKPDAIIIFQFDKFYLRPNFQWELDTLAEKMNGLKKRNALIVGYSDSIGDTAYNLRLSKQRAVAVAAYLARRGIEHHRMVIEGKGHPNNSLVKNSTLFDKNATEQRVVKIFLTPGID